MKNANVESFIGKFFPAYFLTRKYNMIVKTKEFIGKSTKAQTSL